MQNILKSYIECALWSSTDTITAEALELEQFTNYEIGENFNFDDVFNEDDIAPETLKMMESEISDFLAFCKREGIDHSEWSEAQFGHDFWLTRNGHGSGFWDRGLAMGETLTEAAKTFGSACLYVGNDALVYQS
jgi:hypothetical protein